MFFKKIFLYFHIFLIWCLKILWNPSYTYISRILNVTALQWSIFTLRKGLFLFIPFSCGLFLLCFVCEHHKQGGQYLFWKGGIFKKERVKIKREGYRSLSTLWALIKRWSICQFYLTPLKIRDFFNSICQSLPEHELQYEGGEIALGARFWVFLEKTYWKLFVLLGRTSHIWWILSIPHHSLCLTSSYFK